MKNIQITSIAAALFGLITCNSFGLIISTVLNDGQGDFDPWNQTRWAAWYTNGVITETFEIDCNVTFVKLQTPWYPKINIASGNFFLLANNSRGITIDGKGNTIDARLNTDYWLSLLYIQPSLAENNYGVVYGFKCWQTYSSSQPQTVIKDFWLKGFSTAIRTNDTQAHPLKIENVRFRQNRWAIYLQGVGTEVINCNIAEQERGGIYLDQTSHDTLISGTVFRDNDFAQDKFWGDIAVDSTYNNQIENNSFIPSAVSPSYYHCAIKFYRNIGENGDLRETSANHNTICSNSFDGYSVACEVGSRMGINRSYDLAAEGRDHASYNLFTGNTVTNTTFGFKVNCSFNTIQTNTFTNVPYPIVLHCVFYNLFNTTINDQAGDNVFFWFKESDYSGYEGWFSYQNELNGGISECAKLMHVRSDYGSPNFPSYNGCAQVIVAPTLFTDSESRLSELTGDREFDINDVAVLASQWSRTDCTDENAFCNGADTDFSGSVTLEDLESVIAPWLSKLSMADVFSAGGTPIDVAVGNFWPNSPGDEAAVIWNLPISSIGGTDYYSIIIYDCNGVEVDRCGKSAVRWEVIAAGEFLNFAGDEGACEIAAVHSTAVSGYYPVYVFGRGRAEPSVTLLTTNTYKIADLAAGNFDGSADAYDEIAAIRYGGASAIQFCKPSNPGWTATTTGAASLTQIAAGNFDGNASNGDEVAGINASSSLLYFYKVSGTSHYTTAATANTGIWTAIAGGDFDRFASTEEAVVAPAVMSNGVYTLQYYSAGQSTPFRTENQDVLISPVRALAAGRAVLTEIGLYERVEGFQSADYKTTMSSWGQQTVVLPSQPETVSIPLFWLSTNPVFSDRQYLRVTPLLR